MESDDVPAVPAPADVLSDFLQQVRQLSSDYSIETQGGATPDDSEYIELGFTRPDGYGVQLVLAPKASNAGPLTILIGRFAGTGSERAEGVRRWLEDA